MIELRWVTQDAISSMMGMHRLQYRQEIECKYPWPDGSSHEWTEWEDVPYVKDNGDNKVQQEKSPPNL